jgi:hypothetical protein
MALLPRIEGPLYGNTLIVLGLGEAAAAQGNRALAQGLLERSAEMFRRRRNLRFATVAESELGHLLRRSGEDEAAVAIYRRTIMTWQNLGHRPAVANQLECFGFLARRAGRLLRAAVLLGAAEMLRESTHAVMTFVEQREYESELAALREAAPEDELRAAWERGRGLSLDEALAIALEGTAPEAAQSQYLP